MEHLPPNQTLYCRNLNDKIHVKDLKANLYDFFISQGEILAIEARTSQKMRAQAFVVFKDVSVATAALRKMQGKMFIGKPIVIAYARKKSDVVAHMDGTYKRPRIEEPEGKSGKT